MQQVKGRAGIRAQGVRLPTETFPCVALGDQACRVACARTRGRAARLGISPAVRRRALNAAFPPTGFIPPPLIFGAGIDSTCLFWSTFCGEQGACVLYDNVAYRYLYVSIAIALKTFAFLLYTTTWQCLRKNYKRYIKNHEGGLCTSEFFASTLTLDNVGRDPVPAKPTHRTKFIYNLEDHEWCENMESVL